MAYKYSSQSQGLICIQDRSIHSCVTQTFLCNFIGVVISCTPGRNNAIAFCNCLYFLQNIHYFGCWHNAVGIATHCGLDGLGFEPFGDKIFYTHPDQPFGLPSLLYKGYRRSFIRMKGQGHGLGTPTPGPSSSMQVKERVDVYLFLTALPLWYVTWFT